MASKFMKNPVRAVAVADEYRKWADWKVGDYVVGKYVSKTKDSYDKDNYLVQVLEASFKSGSGKSLEGKVIGMNQCGSLAFQIKEVPFGKIIQVTYTGKEEMPESHKYAGKDAHTVELLVEGDSQAEEQEDADDL